MINRLVINGYRGLLVDVELDPLVFITGRNGSGKSSMTQCIQLVLSGQISGLAKKPGAIFQNASGDSIDITLYYGDSGNHIKRRWFKKKNGSITEKVMISQGGQEVEASGRSAAGMIAMALGEHGLFFDSNAFFAQSDRDQTFELLQRLGVENAKDLIEAGNLAKEELNAIRSDKKGFEASIQSMTEGLDERTEKTQGESLSSLKRQQSELKDALEELQKDLSEAEKNQQARDRCENTIREYTSATCSDGPSVKDQLTEAKSNLKKVQQSLKKANESKVDVLLLPKDVRDKIEEDIRRLDEAMNDMGTSTLGYSLVNEVFCSLKTLCPSDAAIQKSKELNEQRAREISDLISKEKALNKSINILTRSAGNLDRKRTESERAKKELKEIGAGPSDELTERHASTKEMYEAVLEKIEVLSESEGVTQEIERAKIALEEKLVEEEKAKAKVDTAQAELKSALAGAQETLITRMSEFLPFGSVHFDVEDNFIGWNIDDVTVRRATLSGAQKAIFDAAFSYAMNNGQGTICIEAAECDQGTLDEGMRFITGHASTDCQVLMCSWAEGQNPTGDWQTITMKNRRIIHDSRNAE